MSRGLDSNQRPHGYAYYYDFHRSAQQRICSLDYPFADTLISAHDGACHLVSTPCRLRRPWLGIIRPPVGELELPRI